MIRFLYHDNFQKEINDLERKFSTIRDGLTTFERLCSVQFDPAEPRQVIAPSKIHKISQNAIWTLWKAELVLPNSGLRPNQWPRVWFAIRGENFGFLCIASHIDNYDDEKINRLAITRVSDLF